MAFSFRPGGYEEDDDFDDDGFYFSGNAHDGTFKQKAFDPVAVSICDDKHNL